MKTGKQSTGRLYPLFFALPAAAAIAFAAVKWGKTITDAIRVLIKMAVIS